MEYVGKLIKVRNQYFITVPVYVYREWRKLLMEEIDMVNMRYDENRDEICVYPHQLKMHGELRKLIQRGSTYLLTVPKDIGSKWYGSGAVFVRKVFSEKDICLTLKPIRGGDNEKVS